MSRSRITPVLSRVKGTIRRYAMIEHRDRVGVAVSGGVDSVALLDILAGLRDELQIELIVLHLNHGIRGEEAARDQQFVRELSAKYALPFFAHEVDVSGYTKESSLSLQAAARELRYRFFEEAVRTHGLDRVALGQTADDQAETVLMRLLRGGGARGLKGIPFVRGSYIRPLITVWREELAAYCRDRGLSFVEDSSNKEEHYLRNRIRHKLLPSLQGYNPAIKNRLLHVAEVLGEDDRYLERLAGEVASQIVIGDEEVSIDAPSLAALPPPLQARVLQLAFAGISSGGTLEYPHIKALMALTGEGGGTKEITLPRGRWAKRTYDTLSLGQRGGTVEGPAEAVDLLVPGRTRLDGLGVEITASVSAKKTPPKNNPFAAYLDYHRLAFPLRARSFLPGDSFIPLGMSAPKKLKNFFIDLKIPRGGRPKVPLVISGEDICWVAGLRIDERFKIEKGTKKVLKLTMKGL